MKKQIFSIAAIAALLYSCGQNKSESYVAETTDDTAEVVEVAEAEDPASEDVYVATDTEPASSQSTNWDALLDEYEDYMNQTVKMAKKAQSGDMSAMTEYASLLEKAERLQKKFENAGNDMTPAQVARLNKIATKLSQQMM